MQTRFFSRADSKTTEIKENSPATAALLAVAAASTLLTVATAAVFVDERVWERKRKRENGVSRRSSCFPSSFLHLFFSTNSPSVAPASVAASALLATVATSAVATASLLVSAAAVAVKGREEREMRKKR